MAERWQTSEGRVAAVFFRDSNGAPVTGLTPTATSVYKDGTAGAPAATATEVSSGFYRVTFGTPPAKDVLVRVDGGSSLTTTRYVALEVPVGGYPDSIDAATSTRATHAEATSDTPGTTTLLARLTATRAGLLDALALLDVAVSTRAVPGDTAGTTTLLARLTAGRAALLDLLANLDVAVSGRASQASVTALGVPAQTSDVRFAHLDADVSSRAPATDTATLLARLTATRAGLLDLLANVDVAVSTRATPADVHTTVTPASGSWQ